MFGAKPRKPITELLPALRSRDSIGQDVAALDDDGPASSTGELLLPLPNDDDDDELRSKEAKRRLRARRQRRRGDEAGRLRSVSALRVTGEQHEYTPLLRSDSLLVDEDEAPPLGDEDEAPPLDDDDDDDDDEQEGSIRSVLRKLIDFDGSDNDDESHENTTDSDSETDSDKDNDEQQSMVTYAVRYTRSHCCPRRLRLPVFFDLIGDRVRNRFLHSLLFALAFLLLVDLLVISRLNDPVTAVQHNSAATLDVFVWPSYYGTLGKPFDLQPQVQLRNRHRIGLPGVRVDVTVRRVYLSSPWLDQRDCDAVANAGLPSLCSYVVTGTSALTNAKGVARFDNLTIVAGPAGVYELVFAPAPQQRVAAKSAVRLVSMQTAVASVQVHSSSAAPPRSRYERPTLPLRSALPPFTVRVADVRNAPLPGKTVSIVPLPTLLPSGAGAGSSSAADVAARFASVEQPLRRALLSGAAAVTDANGLATFDSVQLLGADSAALYFALTAEGVAVNVDLAYPSPSLPVLLPTLLHVDDAPHLALRGSFPSAVDELQPLATGSWQLVVTSNGAPLPGRAVFAQMAVWDGAPWSPAAHFAQLYLATPTQRALAPHKSLLGASVAYTDDDGVATFDDTLAFSTAGPAGDYALRFVVDGVPMVGRPPSVRVQSAVATLLVEWLLDAPVQLLQDVQPLPVVYVLDAQGQPVSGKLPVMRAAGANAADVVFAYRALASDPFGRADLQSFSVQYVAAPASVAFVFLVDGVTSSPVSLDVVANAPSSDERNETCAALVLQSSVPAELRLGDVLPELVFAALPVGGSAAVDAALQARLVFAADEVVYPHVDGATAALDAASGTFRFVNVSVAAGHASRLQFYAEAASERHCRSAMHTLVFVNPVAAVVPLQPAVVAAAAAPGRAVRFDFVLLDADALPLTGHVDAALLEQRTSLRLRFSPADVLRAAGPVAADALFTANVTLALPNVSAVVTLAAGYAGSFFWTLDVAGVSSAVCVQALLAGQVSQLLLLAAPATPLRVGIGQPLGVSVLVADSDGQALPSVRVGVFLCAMNVSELFVATPSSSPWSLPSDAAGVAVWDRLSVWQSFAGVHHLCFAYAAFPDPLDVASPSFVLATASLPLDIAVDGQLALFFYSSTPSVAVPGVPFYPAPIVSLAVDDSDSDDDDVLLSSFVVGAAAVGRSLFYNSLLPNRHRPTPVATLTPATELPAAAVALDPRAYLAAPLFPFVAVNATALSLAPLGFASAEPGLYQLQLTAPGAPPLLSLPIQTAQFATRLEVLVQPPPLVVVNQPFRVQVRALFGGSGLPGLVVGVAAASADADQQLRWHSDELLSIHNDDDDDDADKAKKKNDAPSFFSLPTGVFGRQQFWALTDSTGTATFDVRLTAGASGAVFALHFQPLGDFGAVSATSSGNFTVLNPVTTVRVQRAPRGLWKLPIYMDPVGWVVGASERFAKSTRNIDDAVQSLLQPVVCVADADGAPLAGLVVAATSSAGDIFAWNRSSGVTGADGCARFSRLRVLPGFAGRFRVAFTVSGVRQARHGNASEAMFVDVYSPLLPLPAVQREQDEGAFIFALFLVPLFFANSLWITNPTAVTLSLLCGLTVLCLLLAGRALLFYSLSVETAFSSVQTAWQVFALLLLLATAAVSFFVAVLYWAGKESSHFYEFTRMRRAIAHVKKLLDPNYDVERFDHNRGWAVRTLLAMEAAWRAVKRLVLRCCPCCGQLPLGQCHCCDVGEAATRPFWRRYTEPPFDELQRPVHIDHDSTDDDNDDNDDNDNGDLVGGGGLTPGDFQSARSSRPAALPGHSVCGWYARNMCCPIERRDAFAETDWLLPQRFIMAVLVSLVYTLVAFFWSVWLVRKFEALVLLGQAYVVYAQVWLTAALRLAVGNTPLTGGLFDDYAQPALDLIFDFVLQLLDRVRHRFFWTGCVSAALAVLALCVIWLDIYGAYKRFLLAFRFGDMRGQFDPAQFHVGNASRYPGLQAGHCVFGYLLIFFTFWATLLVFSTGLIRRLLWSFFWDIFVYILGLHLALTVVRLTLVNFVLTSGFDVRYPRVFALWDFVNSLVEIVAGLSSTLLRLAVGVGGLIFTFARIHLPLLGWQSLQAFDSGYAAFVSTVYVDHLYNNPVANTFLYILFERQRYMRENNLRPATAASQPSSRSAVARYLRHLSRPFARRPSFARPVESPDQRELRLSRRRARMRWHLFYTLIRNPTLRQHRRPAGKALPVYHPRVNVFAPPVEASFQ